MQSEITKKLQKMNMRLEDYNKEWNDFVLMALEAEAILLKVNSLPTGESLVKNAIELLKKEQADLIEKNNKAQATATELLQKDVLPEAENKGG